MCYPSHFIGSSKIGNSKLRLCALLCLTALFTIPKLSASSIQFEFTPLGTNGSGQTVDQITYLIDGITLQSTQELDILFSPATYSGLSNPVVGSGFYSTIQQPNNPPGATGFFGIDAISDNTIVTGPFSIDATLVGNAAPGPQEYEIIQFGQNGMGVVAIASGVTSPTSGGMSAVPEPSGIALAGIAMALLALWRAARRSWFGRQSF